MKVKVEFGNARMEKIADCLEKLLSEYKIWRYDDRVFAYFKVKSISDLKKLTTRLKREEIEYKYHRIEKVESWLKKLLRFSLLKS
jgi:hypothetical protein